MGDKEGSTDERNNRLPVDWLLRTLAFGATGGEEGFPVSLIVGGTVIGGQIASEDEFFEPLERIASEVGTPWDRAKPKSPDEMDYIYLKAFSIVTASNAKPIQTRGAILRIALDRVDGFTPGEVSF